MTITQLAQPSTACLDDEAECQSFLPGHRLHWSHYKKASANTVRVTHVTVRAGQFELTVDGEDTPLRWQHHHPGRLMFALEHATHPILASPAFHALRIDGYWFNCAPVDIDLSDHS